MLDIFGRQLPQPFQTVLNLTITATDGLGVFGKSTVMDGINGKNRKKRHVMVIATSWLYKSIFYNRVMWPSWKSDCFRLLAAGHIFRKGKGEIWGSRFKI